MAKPKAVASNQSPVRVIKRGTCSTISGKTEINYCLGSDVDDQLKIRVHSNSGGGFFSNEWVAMTDILKILESWDSDTGITSVALGGLFRGKSVNTPAFLMAALRAEGIFQPLDGKQRTHEVGDVQAWLATAKQLQSGKAPRKAAAKKPPAKRKVPSRPTKGK